MSSTYSDFSVVLQGPVSGSPERPIDKTEIVSNILSVKKALPRATIIVTTWVNEDTSGIPEDVIVIRSADPGPDAANLQRQLVSVQAALDVVKTEYCLKSRTDYRMDGDIFIKSYIDGNELQKVAITNIFSKRPSLRSPYYFHFSDTVQLGRTSEIKKIWSLRELRPMKVQVENFWKQVAPWTMYLEYYRKWNVAMAPEQAIWSGYAARFHEFDFPHGAASNRDAIRAHKWLMREKLIIFDSFEFGIYNRKHISEVTNFRARSRLLQSCDSNATSVCSRLRSLALSVFVNLLDCAAIAVRWRKYKGTARKNI